MNTTKKYDEAFKSNAVSLALSWKQSFTKITLDLGVAQSTLCRWVINSKLGRHGNLSDKSALQPAALYAIDGSDNV